MGVMRPGAPNTAPRGSHYDRNFELSVGNVVDGRGLLNNFADRFQDKVEEDNVNNGTASGERRSNAQTGLSAFGNRSVAYTFSAELSPQAAALLEVSAARADARPM